jgi:hypothetical protein
MCRGFGIRVCTGLGAVVVGACTLLTAPSEARASCGDWLQHAMPADGALESLNDPEAATQNESRTHSQLPVTPCDGPNCGQRSSKPIGMPPPTVEPEGQERCCRLAEEMPRLPPAISFRVSLNSSRGPTVFQAALLRPPSSLLIISATA